MILELAQVGKDGLAGEFDALLNCERFAPPGFNKPCKQLKAFTDFIRECLALQGIHGIKVPDFKTVRECKTWLEKVTKNGRMLSFMAIHCHVERLRGGITPNEHGFLDAIRDMGCQLGWNENVYFTKPEPLRSFKHAPRYDSSSTQFTGRRGNRPQLNVNPGKHFGYGQGKSTDYCIAVRANHPLLNVRVTLAALNTLNFEWMKWIGCPEYWAKDWDQCEEEVVLPLRNRRLSEIKLRREDLWEEVTALSGRVEGWFEDHPEPPRTADVVDGIAPHVCPSCQGLGDAHNESFCTYDDATPSSSGKSSPRRTHGLHPFPRPRPLPEPPRPGFSSLAKDGQSLLTEGKLASLRRSENVLDKVDRNFEKDLSRLNPKKRQKTEATNVEGEKAAKPDTRTEAQKERQRRINKKKKEQQKASKKKKATRAEVVAESKAQIFEHLKYGVFSREKVKDILDKIMAKARPKPGAGAHEAESIGQYGLPIKEEAAFRSWAKLQYLQHLRLIEAGESSKLFGMFELPADISEEDFNMALVNNIGVVENRDKGGFEIGWKLDVQQSTESQEALPEDALQDALDNQLGQSSAERSSVKEQEAPGEAVKPQPQDVQYPEPVLSSQTTPEQDPTPVLQSKQPDNGASEDVSQPAAESSTGPEAAPEAAPSHATDATPTVAPTDPTFPNQETSNHADTSALNPPPLDKSKEASKAKKERRKLRKRLERQQEEARVREEAAAREERRRQAEAQHQAKIDRKVAEAQRKLDEEKARRLEQQQKDEAARLQRVKEEEARLQRVKEEEAKKREEEEARKRGEEKKRQEDERRKTEERITEELRRQIEEEARLQAEKEWHAKEEQRKLKEAAQQEEARRIALKVKQKAELEAKQKTELEVKRLVEVEAKRKAEQDRKAEQKRKVAEAKREAEVKREAEAKRKVEEAKKKAEEARLKAEEEARLKKEEEANRKAEEKKRQAEAKRLAEEKRKAEAARLTEAKRLADDKKQAETKRTVEEQQRQAELKRQTELERLAEMKRKADDEKRKADEAALQAAAAFQAEVERQAEVEHQAELKHQAEEKAAAEAKLKAEAEARLRAEREARLKTERKARLKAEQQAKFKAEAEAKAAAEAKRKADPLKRQQAE